MLDFITEKTDCWDYLKSTDLPVFIYGMGDGALKIMSVFERYGIPLAGFFASDEFVRGHTFQGHLVHTLSQIETLIDDFVIVLAFAAGYQSLYDRINEIAKRHILLAPDVPVAGETLFTYKYCQKNAEKIQSVYDMLAEVKPQDLTNFGLIPEFVGRVPIVVSLHPLNEDALVNILTQPKNAIIKQYQKLIAMDGVKLTVEDGAVREIANTAIRLKTGARGLRTIIEGFMTSVMYKLPSEDNVAEVIVTKECVTDKAEPKIIYKESA